MSTTAPTYYGFVGWKPIEGYRLYWYTGQPVNYHMPLCTFADAVRVAKAMGLPLHPEASDPRIVAKA